MADSRYPNMSYCMFENTQAAMGQLLAHMREALDAGPNAVKEFLEDMSREETRAYQEMFQMCEEFMEVVEEIEHSVLDADPPEEEEEEETV